MNRYTAAGVLADMRQGRRVVVLSGTQTEARQAFAQVVTYTAEGEKVYRANGNERIAAVSGGGWVKFGTSGGNRFRGITADVVVFDAHKPSREAVDAALPIVLAAIQGEVIRM